MRVVALISARDVRCNIELSQPLKNRPRYVSGRRGGSSHPGIKVLIREREKFLKFVKFGLGHQLHFLLGETAHEKVSFAEAAIARPMQYSFPPEIRDVVHHWLSLPPHRPLDKHSKAPDARLVMRPSVLNPLFSDVTSLQGIGPRLAALIGRVAGPRVVDLVLFPPTGLIDRTFFPSIAEAPFGMPLTLAVRVDRHDPPPNRRTPYRILCSDETGYLTLIYFNPKREFLERQMPVGARRLISGKLEDYGGSRQMTHPERVSELSTQDDPPGPEPVYPLTASLSANVMRKAVFAAVARVPLLPEWQDPAWLIKNKWPDWNTAVSALHHPKSAGDLSSSTDARRRLAYDEILADQLALMLVRRRRRKSPGRVIAGNGAKQSLTLAALPYELTKAQKLALTDILGDMAGPGRMVRLVQGDVGSGKTIVAFLAILAAVEAGAQGALLAPTEILARQHISTLAPLASIAGVSIDILSGRDKGPTRSDKLERLAKGHLQIVVGTHALFQEKVSFHDLGLVVIDEQHRFGVHQRLALAAKGARPHTLVMTATPIPRTLALTAYGDMDTSAIQEKPQGRKSVVTRAIPMERLDEVTAAVARAISRDEQAYWVCPLVEESEHVPLTAVEQRYAALREEFGERVGLAHGKLPADQKDAVMAAFHRGDLSVLIATTVIEVGVDAPNATIIIIEHAEHFGLAQLHQLRGRVGRGQKPGACLLLFKGPLSEAAAARLKILRETDDGFRIAEEDLRLRGAGDLLGAAQSGLPTYRLADLVAHADLILAARDDAKLILERDPELKTARGAAIRTLLYLFSKDEAVRLLGAG